MARPAFRRTGLVGEGQVREGRGGAGMGSSGSGGSGRGEGKGRGGAACFPQGGLSIPDNYP